MIVISEYFDGAVKSLGYDSKDGKSTIGIIEKGEYKLQFKRFKQAFSEINELFSKIVK